MRAPRSLRSQLLLGILLPVTVLVVINAFSLYHQALHAADTAYDRTLLASAKSIGEQMNASASGGVLALNATVLYSALEAFEADNRSRIFYRVAGFSGETVSGFGDLPSPRRGKTDPGPYAALVDFYDAVYRGEAVRMAVLLQPVSSADGTGMATIQVAETLELRHTLARQILIDTAWRQAALVGVIVLVVLVAVQLATKPVRQLSQQMSARVASDLSPIETREGPRELWPLLQATNQVMQRLRHLLSHQKRFVRDASHQLRTPLAVLKTQVQSALRGDVEPMQALSEIQLTVDRATQLANQMLNLAKVEQLRQQNDAPVMDWADITRAVALDLAPLIAQQPFDFDIETQPTPVRAHEWALRELTRNLLHNAIIHSSGTTANSPRLSVRVMSEGNQAVLAITDSGPGISTDQRLRLFQPFASGGPRHGSGLGLTICGEIVQSLQGHIDLDNLQSDGPNQEGLTTPIAGLQVRVRLPVVLSPVTPFVLATADNRA
jgi:two-component system, OmpR family, sensor histidine kinase TctE